MQHLSLEAIAERLVAHLQCEQDDLCLPMVHQVARGKPLTKAVLGASLQMREDELERRLARLPDTEFDQQGNIVGWGVTLVPTRHCFQLDGKLLFTWCAFDTVLFPPSLAEIAHVQSTCSVTGQSITFVATPFGTVKDLTPTEACMSLIIPAKHSDCVRATFCEHSLFFWSEQTASPFLAVHAEAVLLSIEEAAQVGKLIAESRFTRKKDKHE
jgi:alkylmercury lyase